nr:MAG TPA: Short C-terminal domain [Caudoviricetes sp.]
MGIFFSWIIFSFVAGAVGSGRKIGFWGAFLLSIILSPLIGLIIAFASSRKEPNEVKIVNNYTPPAHQALKMPDNSDVISKLNQANDLKEKGAITQEEYERIKSRILRGE